MCPVNRRSRQAEVGAPSFEEARELAGWRPPLGVVSVYLRRDPADRGAWRTELRNGIAAILEAAPDRAHEERSALRATARRIAERYSDPDGRPLPRGEIGFVEVAAEPGVERWWSTHTPPPPGPTVHLADRPVVAPLISVARSASRRGVALLSAERVRLLEWSNGRLEELHSWELTVFSLDWRERKAPRSADPARSQGVSAAGHEQFAERLGENRQRFLGECGRLAAGIAAERGWPETIAFGAPEHARSFREGAPAPVAVESGGERDLISEPTARLETAVATAVGRLGGERDRRLAEHALDEALGGRRGASGAEATDAALEEGRVDCLLLDLALLGNPTAPIGPVGERLDGAGRLDAETLVRRALESGAGVAPISAAAAELLAPAAGVAAVLRY